MFVKSSILAALVSATSLLSVSSASPRLSRNRTSPFFGTKACNTITFTVTVQVRWYGDGWSSELWGANGYYASTGYKISRMGFEDCSDNGDYCYKMGQRFQTPHAASLQVGGVWRNYARPNNDHQEKGVYQYWDCI